MKIEERMKRYFRTEIYNHMTQVRYFSKKICVEIFSELAQNSGKALPSRPRLFHCSIECIFLRSMLCKLQTNGANGLYK